MHKISYKMSSGSVINKAVSF